MGMVEKMAPGADTEVSSTAKRRRFTAAEKLRIVREADSCAGQKGAIGALLRREGLYSSLLAAWRRQRDAGQFGPKPRRRGPMAKMPDPRDRTILELERRARRAEARADRAERLVEIQKKLAELLGIQLPEPENEQPR
jgi:transposase